MSTAAALLGLAVIQVGLQSGPVEDSLPQVTLAEALQAASRLDPNYVAATRQVVDAQWSRTAAMTVFVVPALSAQLSGTRYSNQAFNIGTGAPASQVVDARIQGRLNLFSGFGKINELKRANAQLEGARAGELQARYVTALFTEADFFDVLAQREFLRVTRERAERAEEQLGVARARVLTGAAVQTDSLQLLLELTEAQVDLIRQEARLQVARYQLGRRVGADGPVDAASLARLGSPDLPLSQQEAIDEAFTSSPSVLVARSEQRAAESALSVARGSYLPSIDLVGQISAFDDSFFPDAVNRSSIGLTLTFPIWNDARRESAVSRATTVMEVAQAARADVERALRRDVVEAYQAYEAARAAQSLAERAVVVAAENLRVQQERYRAGATTILDLLAADGRMSDADAGLVQALYTTRLALTGLEAILGRRLFPNRGRDE
jgi:outer membrane protein TolC